MFLFSQFRWCRVHSSERKIHFANRLLTRLARLKCHETNPKPLTHHDKRMFITFLPTFSNFVYFSNALASNAGLLRGCYSERSPFVRSPVQRRRNPRVVRQRPLGGPQGRPRRASSTAPFPTPVVCERAAESHRFLHQDVHRPAHQGKNQNESPPLLLFGHE